MEDFGDVRWKRSTRCGGGRKFFADDPALELWPGFVCGPAGVFRPLAFYGGIPVAFVSSAEPGLLSREPFRFFHKARFGDERERREFSF